MATRAYWSGHIRISLVSFAVKLFPAFNPARQIAFHQIDRKSGQRVRNQLIVPDVGPIDRDDIVKGYEYKKGEYVEIDPEDLKALRLPSKDTIDILQFVDLSDIEPVYYDRPYYIVPDDKMALPAFATVREAMRASHKAALGEVVFGGKEHLAAIRACGRGLLMETLRYSDEVRQSSSYFDAIEKIEIEADQLDLARGLIDQKTAPLDMSKFSDSYEDAVRELVEAKLHDKPLPKTEKSMPQGNVINLMDALKNSLTGNKQNSPSRPARLKSAKAVSPKPSLTEAHSGRPRRKVS